MEDRGHLIPHDSARSGQSGGIDLHTQAGYLLRQNSKYFQKLADPFGKELACDFTLFPSSKRYSAVGTANVNPYIQLQGLMRIENEE